MNVNAVFYNAIKKNIVGKKQILCRAAGHFPERESKRVKSNKLTLNGAQILLDP